MSLYFYTITKNREQYIAVTQLYFLITGLYGTSMRILSGIVTKDIAILLIPSVFGKLLGTKTIDYISKTVVEKLICLVLLCSGIFTLLELF